LIEWDSPSRLVERSIGARLVADLKRSKSRPYGSRVRIAYPQLNIICPRCPVLVPLIRSRISSGSTCLQHREAGAGSVQFESDSSARLDGRRGLLWADLSNDGQVRLWPYPRANGEHTIDALRRLRAEFRRGRLLIVSPALQPSWPPSGRIRSPRDIACRQEAAKQVSSQPRGLSRYSRSRQIWLECMKRPR
jgi:hypothetical protein